MEQISYCRQQLGIAMCSTGQGRLIMVLEVEEKTYVRVISEKKCIKASPLWLQVSALPCSFYCKPLSLPAFCSPAGTVSLPCCP